MLIFESQLNIVEKPCSDRCVGVKSDVKFPLAKGFSKTLVIASLNEMVVREGYKPPSASIHQWTETMGVLLQFWQHYTVSRHRPQNAQSSFRALAAEHLGHRYRYNLKIFSFDPKLRLDITTAIDSRIDVPVIVLSLEQVFLSVNGNTQMIFILPFHCCVSSLAWNYYNYNDIYEEYSNVPGCNC